MTFSYHNLSTNQNLKEIMYYQNEQVQEMEENLKLSRVLYKIDYYQLSTIFLYKTDKC